MHFSFLFTSFRDIHFLAKFDTARTFGEEELIKFNSQGTISRVVFPESGQRDLIIALKIYSITAN